MVKEAQEFAEELRMDLKLQHRDPTDQTAAGERIETPKIGDWIKKEVQSNRYKEIKKGKWQGKLITGWWQDDKLYGECFFSWMSEWKTASAYTVAGIH